MTTTRVNDNALTIVIAGIGTVITGIAGTIALFVADSQPQTPGSDVLWIGGVLLCLCTVICIAGLVKAWVLMMIDNGGTTTRRPPLDMTPPQPPARPKVSLHRRRRR